MKQRILSILFVFAITTIGFSQSGYKFNVDLNNVNDDKLFIELITPKIDTDKITYHLPKLVPGTYDIYNFGRFVSEFTASDSSGNQLPVYQQNHNSWEISEAKKLFKITYKIEDTWDTKITESFVFEPAGSNFEKDKNFVLNTHCLFGFFDDLLKLNYEVNITHPSNFYGSCSLTDVTSKNNTDT